MIDWRESDNLLTKQLQMSSSYDKMHDIIEEFENDRQTVTICQIS